ncbi:MAG: MFS transporter [Weeksellaceae bacterium]|nr:MFS transporter [Weeksellaceae bacterium]
MQNTVSTPKFTSKQIRLAVTIFYFCTGLIFSSWASRIPTIKNKLGISEGELGSLLLVMPIGEIITLALVGKMVALYGSKNVFRLGILGYALLLLAIPFATTFWSLAAILTCFGIFSNSCNIAINTQGVDVEKVYNRSIMSSFHGAWSLAGFVGALIGLLLMNFEIDILTHFIIIFIIILGLLFSQQKYLFDHETFTGEQKKGFVKPDKTLIQLGIIGFLGMATEGTMFDWSGVYFHEIVKAPEKWTTLGYAAFMITMASGRFIGDKFIERFGKRRVLQVSGILMGSGLLISVFFPTLVICTMAFMLVGLGVACTVPAVYSVAGQHKTINPGVALAMVSSISFLGFLLGPPLIGYIAEMFDLRYSYALFAVFGFVLAVMVTKIKLFKG